MEIKNMNIHDIHAYVDNPRHNDEAIDKVKESIREFGFKVPIVVDKNNEIIAGHTRKKAALEIGIKEVPVIIADDLTDEQVRAFRLADNKVAEFSEWDMELLQSELNMLDDMDMDVFGFEDMEDDFEEEEEVEEDDYEIEVPEDPKSAIGDIYQLGRHRLMCGDSTKEEDVSKLMNDKEADLFITDPPYNVSYTGKTKEMLTIENDQMEDEDFRSFLRSAFQTANDFMKPGSAFYIWHADLEGYNFRGACRDIDWQVRECLIWVKNSMVMGRQDYHWKHEPCLYGWKPGASHRWESDRKQTTVLEFDRPTKNIEHPTMKPIALFDYQIKNNTIKGDNILDLFGGSGTTIMACEQSNRNGYTMELDPKYCDVIINRWEEYTGQKAVKL